MELQVQVTFSLSERLFELLEDKLPDLGKRVKRAVKKQIGAEVDRESEIRVAVKRADEAPQPETPQPEATEAPAEAPAPTAEATVFKIEDCREAIHRTRVRIEGEDYANKTEGYEKYHKPITSFVKQIVIELSGGSAEKLPQLSTEFYGAFIKEIEGLYIDNNGELSRAKAPF